MSNIPDVDEPIIEMDKKGVATQTFRLFLETLQSIIDLPIGIYYQGQDFDSLALLQATIKNPANNLFVMINGQGLARYKASSSTWVLASDDTTAVT